MSNYEQSTAELDDLEQSFDLDHENGSDEKDALLEGIVTIDADKIEHAALFNEYIPYYKTFGGQIMLDGRIKPALVREVHVIQEVLSDPEIAEFMELDMSAISQLDLTEIESQINTLNERFYSETDVPLEEEFYNEIAPLVELYAQFYERLCLRNPEHLIKQTEEQIRRLHPNLDERFDGLFQILYAHPNLTITPYRWEQANKDDVYKVLPEEAFNRNNSKIPSEDKLQKLWDIAQTLPSGYSAHSYHVQQTYPELSRTFDCLYMFAMGTRDP